MNSNELEINENLPEVYEIDTVNIIYKDKKTFLIGDFGEIEILEEIGEGEISKSFKINLTFNYVNEDGINKIETYPYAMKVLNRFVLKNKIIFGFSRTETVLDKLYREIKILKKIKHTNIVRLYMVIDDQNVENIYLIMEIANLGQIMKWNGKDKYERLSNIYNFLEEVEPILKISPKKIELNDYLNSTNVEVYAKLIFKQIVDGLAKLHENNIAHKDLTWGNILAKKNENNEFQVLIIDFSISEDLGDNPDELYFDIEGTAGYQPPEFFETIEGYKLKPVDIWELGICLYTFIYLEFPFKSDGNYDNLEFKDNISAELQDLLKNLLNKNPEKRIKIEEVSKHPWLI